MNTNLAGTSGQAMVVNAKGGKYRGKHIKGKGKTRGKPYSCKKDISDTSDLVYYYCTKKGHKSVDCRIKAAAIELKKGREERHRNSVSGHYSNAGGTIVQGLIAKGRKSGNPNPPTTEEWIVDSGATHHISPILTDFQCYRTLEKPLYVDTADSVSLATAVGSIHLQLHCGILLRVEALYVPDFGASLLSVPQLNKDGYDVIFRSRTATAYISSNNLTEQPLGRRSAGSLSCILLGRSIRAQAHLANANLTCQSDSANSNLLLPPSLDLDSASGPEDLDSAHSASVPPMI